MRFGKHIEKEANNFFKKYGLEEKLAELTDIWVDECMIRGEITEDLQEMLRRSPENLIDAMGENFIGDDFAAKLTRAEKENLLYEYIPGSLKEQLAYMNPMNLKLLVRVATQKPISMIETTTIYDELASRGWVFMFIQDNSCQYVVSKEVKDVIATLESEEVKCEMQFVFTWRLAITVCLALYGVCTQEQLIYLYKKISGLGEYENYIKWGEDNFEELTNIFAEQGLLWKDNGYIISGYIQDEKEYIELLRIQNKKYYIPDNEVVQAYAFGELVVKNTSYKMVLQLLTKELHDMDQAEGMLEEISGYVIREDWVIPQVMKCLESWDVQFANDSLRERFIFALAEWLYGIHRWSECGYSRKELGKENLDSKYVKTISKENAEQITVKKYTRMILAHVEAARNIKNVVEGRLRP